MKKYLTVVVLNTGKRDNMIETKVVFYSFMILGFLGAGLCEFDDGNYRIGSASLLLGLVQALIFLIGRE